MRRWTAGRDGARGGVREVSDSQVKDDGQGVAETMVDDDDGRIIISSYIING